MCVFCSAKLPNASSAEAAGDALSILVSYMEKLTELFDEFPSLKLDKSHIVCKGPFGYLIIFVFYIFYCGQNMDCEFNVSPSCRSK